MQSVPSPSPLEGGIPDEQQGDPHVPDGRQQDIDRVPRGKQRPQHRNEQQPYPFAGVVPNIQRMWPQIHGPPPFRLVPFSSAHAFQLLQQPGQLPRLGCGQQRQNGRSPRESQNDGAAAKRPMQRRRPAFHGAQGGQRDIQLPRNERTNLVGYQKQTATVAAATRPLPISSQGVSSPASAPMRKAASTPVPAIQRVSTLRAPSPT